KHEIAHLHFSEDDKILICSSKNGNIIIYKNEYNNTLIGEWKYAYKIINNNNIIFNDLNIVNIGCKNDSIIDHDVDYKRGCKGDNNEKTEDNIYTIVGITNNRHIIFHHYNFNENSVTISYLQLEQIYTPTCISETLYFYNRKILCICNEASKLRFFDLKTKKIIKTIQLPFKDKTVQKFIALVDCDTKYDTCSHNFDTNATTAEVTTTFQHNKMHNISSYKNIKNDFKKNNIFLFALNEQMIVFTQSPIDANCLRYIGGIVCSGKIKNVLYKNKRVFILTNNKIFY
ncbi:WD repeat-containing protein 66, putative, partial [Hepatocystis sp. ex Piliocolobus tephrosceles]